MSITTKWFDWSREIFSISQAGLTYSQNEYDIQRYKRLVEITTEIIASQSELSQAAVMESFSMQAGYITPKVDVRGAVMRDGKIWFVDRFVTQYQPWAEACEYGNDIKDPEKSLKKKGWCQIP